MIVGDAVKVNAGKWIELVSGTRRGLFASLQRFVLACASLPYCLIMRLRNWCYDQGWLHSHRVSVPVVVVGNMTVGGTGKTPAVEYIARFYRQFDRRLTILSRGYGAETSRNDEAMVLETNLDDVPHLQGVDRVDLAHRAIEELETELLLLDDGFQHRRLSRNLDIILIDATNPWGFDWCLPRGLLREPLSGIKRAGVVLISRVDQVPAETLHSIQNRLSRLAPNAIIAMSRHAAKSVLNTCKELPVDVLHGRNVLAFCGIGNPDSFFHSLQQLGCHIIETKRFPDHHSYQRGDVSALETLASQLPSDCWIVTTQKDWVKLRVDQLGGKPLWSVRIGLEITQGRSDLEQALQNAIEEKGRDSSPLDPVFGRLHSSLFSGKDAYDHAAISPV